jgi:hypothetical protein
MALQPSISPPGLFRTSPCKAGHIQTAGIPAEVSFITLELHFCCCCSFPAVVGWKADVSCSTQSFEELNKCIATADDSIGIRHCHDANERPSLPMIQLIEVCEYWRLTANHVTVPPVAGSKRASVGDFGRRIMQSSECSQDENVASRILFPSVVALVVTVAEYQYGCCKATDGRISFEVWMRHTDISASDVPMTARYGRCCKQQR